MDKPCGSDLPATPNEIERLRAELETEIARNRPLRALVSSLKSINTDFRQRIKELKEAGNTLESEREANAILSAENAELRKDAERYRWLRHPDQPVGNVLDKRVGTPHDLHGVWEYRAGQELDDAMKEQT